MSLLDENIRYGCWLVYNVLFSGEDFTKTVTFKGQAIEILVTSYENTKALGKPFHDWIHIGNSHIRMIFHA